MSKEKVDKLRETICRKNREALQMKTENKRLRGLLRKCLPCLVYSTSLPLYDEVAQEVGDE